MSSAGSAPAVTGQLRDALTASEIAQVLHPRCPELSRADLELCAQHLLTEIYEGIRRGGQICIADFAADGAVDLSYLVIERRDQ
jgi:hypothetical protein